jgi:glycosyltransferase involved in cell wall biosynthesis
MRILVASAFEASSQWAHAINTIKMAQGFARLGNEVTLVCRRPPEGKVLPTESAARYGLNEPIYWVQLPQRVLNYYLDPHWHFALQALPVILHMRPDLVFTRNYIFPWLSSRLGLSTVAESHAYPDNKTAPFLRMLSAARHGSFRLLVTISQRLADHYHSLGVPNEKLIVLPDAVDLQLFQRPESQNINPYPNKKSVVAYVGHLYDYKGIPTVLQAASLLPTVQFHLVGGWQEDVKRHQSVVKAKGLRNVTLHGLKPHAEIPPYLWNADVLLLPPSAKHPSAAWTSPLKLGEYLASGVPIVATDIPALRDWVTEDEVEFVAPDDPEALAEGIRRLLTDHTRKQALSEAGLRKAQQLSCEKRATAILEKIGLS